MRVIDLFSGPGGLGEGFASFNDGTAFNIGVSAEMEASAHSTLVLRAFYRLAKKAGDQKAIHAYYAFCNSASAKHPCLEVPLLWEIAKQEARQLKLGESENDKLLDTILESKKLGGDDTVLIGGPPCQAYSHIGRARNKGKTDYVAENDSRHFLYREYLRVLANTKPAVFIMENVKGILSSSPGGQRIFHEILYDLCDPVWAIRGEKGPMYVIHSLTTETKFEEGVDFEKIDVRDFIIKAENYGIPQARHRVILLGVREDIKSPCPKLLQSPRINVRSAISELPALRSQISPLRNDSPANWYTNVNAIGQELAKSAANAGMNEISQELEEVCKLLDANLQTGGIRVNMNGPIAMETAQTVFSQWVKDSELSVWLNHQAKSHMPSDLGRYLYASVFTKVKRRSPRGQKDFSLPGLAPDHANWGSGHFLDRFRVQHFDDPSMTMTCHIAKDGHSIIHPDPLQCRALSVREAARLQTFPDNYFFQGTKTEQYHQVGNAVPPLLANQIAKVVFKLVS